MSTTSEDLRKIMNLVPFASPFSETFDPATDSLEAIRGAIDALEAGIFGYGVVAGAQIVEIDDKAEYAVELLNPGGAIIPAGSITPGTYTIHRIRDGTKTEIYTHAAAAADGRVELDTPYEYLIASWASGDLYMVVFSGIVTTIGSTLTNFPDMILTGRIARDEEIENILEYTTAATLKDAIEDDTDSIYNRLGDPTGRTNYKSLYAMLELDDTANYNLDDILRTGFTTAGANLGTGSIMERIGTIANAAHNRSVLEGMGLPDTDLTTLYELLVIGYTTAGANLGTGSIMERIGTIGNAAHNRSVLEGMGLPDTDLTTLYELMVTGYVTEGAATKAGALIEKLNYAFDIIEDDTDSVLNRIGAFDGGADAQGDIFQAIDPPADGHGIMTVLGKDDEDSTNATWDTDHWEGTVLARLQKALLVLVNGTGSEIGANLSIIDLIGAFDGGVDPQGDIYQALGVPATASIWDAVQYIEDVACPAAPVAGSILQVLVEDITERTLGETTLEGLLGVPDVAAYSLWANIGNFMGRTGSTDRTLMDVIGIPDDANGSLYDRFGTFTSVNNLYAILGAGVGGFTPTDNLFASLGGYDADDSLKDHLDYVDVTAIPGAPLTKTMIYYLQAIGSNDADNDFASPLVVANPIGSVLERLQHLQDILDDSITDATHDIEVADGVGEVSIATFTPHRNGKAGIEFDLQALITAGEGGTVTVRLKHQIDNTTARTIDKVDFVIGVDEVHPTVEGWIDSNNTNGAEITIQCSVGVTATRVVPYKIVEAA